MAELKNAIDELWDCFLSPPQHGSLTSFCQNLIRSDERFPNDFLQKFIHRLSEWKQSDDPEFKAAKKMMHDLFLRHKKNEREQRRKQAKALANEVIPIAPTAEEIAMNVAKMRKNIQKADEDYAKEKRQELKDNKLGRTVKKTEAQLKIIANIRKNT